MEVHMLAADAGDHECCASVQPPDAPARKGTGFLRTLASSCSYNTEHVAGRQGERRADFVCNIEGSRVEIFFLKV